MKKVHLAVAISISILLPAVTTARADDLVSLDDPAPAKAGAPAAGGESLESLDSLDDAGAGADAAPLEEGADLSAGSGGDGEVALDLGSAADSFNPYSFSRTPAWAFLPLGALMLVGLHLLRVPKRKSKRKIDQARRFFRGISGEGTSSAIMMPPKKEESK